MENQTSTIKSKYLILGAIILAVGIVVLAFSSGQKGDSSSPKVKDSFLGEKGISVEAQDNRVYIKEGLVSDGQLQAFSYFSPSQNKTIYFFIVQASDGTYRAAANACEVCFESHLGFRQIGDSIRCENCQVTYNKNQIALEKGGCNPGPIDKDVTVEDGQLVLEVADLEAVAYLF